MSQVEKSKRGRKKKSDKIENITITIEKDKPNDTVIPKKRGRKPKGGKIIQKDENVEQQITTNNNVILHLKCSLSDIKDQSSDLQIDNLTYNPDVPPEIESYNTKSQYYSIYDKQNSIIDNVAYSEKSSSTYICSKCNSSEDSEENVNMKDIQTKLKNLKINIYKDELQDKKSACFWCTYEYDNPICMIPKQYNDDKIYGYGSFCRPECAAAYLMKENIDDSTKFERYDMLNHIYGKIYNFKKNIKPAPNPYYTLDKFYGNLSIQEYRKLLNSDHLLLVIDKPMTRILPELYEDNDKFSMNVYGESSGNNTYKVKRQSDKGQVKKNNIIKDTFNIV